MHGETPDALIAAADAALYETKRAGGDGVLAAARPRVPAA
jgi:PleD family two-component response regulator